MRTEGHGARSGEGLLDRSRNAAARSAPIVTDSAVFSDYQTYGLMTDALLQAVLYSLRRMPGDDAFRDGLRRQP